MILLPLLFSLPCSTPVQEVGVLRSEDRWVEINPYGLLIKTPAGGVEALDGPHMPLRGDFAEWYGLSYRSSTGSWNGCAAGSTEDWSTREALEHLDFACDGKAATALARLAALEVRTDLCFDSDGEHLIVGVVITNRGDSIARDIVYTREVRDGGGSGEGWNWPDDLLRGRPAPPDLMRKAWMLDDLRPGASNGLTLSYAWPRSAGVGAGVDVPLELWTNASWPAGFDFNGSTGLTWVDYDADGWSDLFSLTSGRLFRNLAGQDWEYIANLRPYMHPPGPRYSASWADYDEDGLPDFVTEPRLNGCIHLMKNLGGTVFFDLAPYEYWVDDQGCSLDSETACWGDVDGDLDLDLFLPAYPTWAAAGEGNRFWRNLGPFGSRALHRMQEMTQAGGFENPPPDSARPEGAQFCDVDFDGDLDLYSNGTLYQNRSSLGEPRVEWMRESGSGILFHDRLDEGAALGDYDMDGDFDIFIAYIHPGLGVQLWENRGDGTFFRVEEGVVEDFQTGLGFGLSIADWDQDGDLDFTTRQVFRRNQLVETGTRLFTTATHNIESSHLNSATPTWADWDRDGDLDCGLGNSGSDGYFYENVLYGPQTAPDERRVLRVKPVRDSELVPAGLETEYGAVVEVRILDGGDGLVRRQFTASSAGYLNQNEYALHFGLPADPAPEDDRIDHHVEVVVDFPSLPSLGNWRVDRHVNPVLGDIDLAQLTDREIRVWRHGRVLLDGVLHPPSDSETPVLLTAGHPLSVADPEDGLPGLEDAGGPGRWIGLDFDTLGSTQAVRVREIVLDGQLDRTGLDNVLLWDVTTPGSPRIVPGGRLTLETSERNRRSYFAVDWQLDLERHYRLCAHVRALRSTELQGSLPPAEVNVRGGLDFFGDPSGLGNQVERAPLDPTRMWLTFRYGEL